MQGANAADGIWGEGIASPYLFEHQTVIEGNTLASIGSVFGSCIQINEPETTNQFNVNILNNQCSGYVAYDIVAYNPGPMTIESNFLGSGGTTDSINVGTRQSGIIKVEKNTARNTITAWPEMSPADLRVFATTSA